MKHIVFIVGSYYPYYSAVGKCMRNIANEFEKNYKVTVICEKNMVDQADKDVLNTQKIIRVTTKMHNKRIMIDDKMKKSQGIKRHYWRCRLYMSKVERFVKVAISKSACDKDVVSAYMDGLKRICEPIDVIIPTCNPFDTVVAALQYKRLYPNVQIIPYLFDLFAANLNVNRGKALLYLVNVKI